MVPFFVPELENWFLGNPLEKTPAREPSIASNVSDDEESDVPEEDRPLEDVDMDMTDPNDQLLE